MSGLVQQFFSRAEEEKQEASQMKTTDSPDDDSCSVSVVSGDELVREALAPAYSQAAPATDQQKGKSRWLLLLALFGATFVSVGIVYRSEIQGHALAFMEKWTSEDVPMEMEPSILTDEVQENTRMLFRLGNVVSAIAHAQRASEIARTETQAMEQTPIIQYVSKRDSEGFGEFLIPEKAQWYCQICQKRPLAPGSLAFGCQKEYANDPRALYDNCGCCEQCYRELGWLDAADELKDMKHHKDAKLNKVQEPKAQEPEVQAPTGVRLSEYVSARDEEGFGVYKIPDNKYTYYCPLCGKQPLEKGSLAFGCQREYESDPAMEYDNLGCCYECAQARGWKQTVHALKHKGCHCRR